MREVNLFEAWSLWLSGEQISNYFLFKVKILWWARFGKLLQFVSALTIIIDIVGIDRLRNFSAFLHKLFSINLAKKYFSKVTHFLADSLDRIGGSKETPTFIEMIKGSFFDKLNLVTTFLILLAYVVPWVFEAFFHWLEMISPEDPSERDLGPFVLAFSISFSALLFSFAFILSSISPILIGCTSLLLIAFVTIFDLLVIDSLSFFLLGKIF